MDQILSVGRSLERCAVLEWWKLTPSDSRRPWCYRSESVGWHMGWRHNGAIFHWRYSNCEPLYGLLQTTVISEFEQGHDLGSHLAAGWISTPIRGAICSCLIDTFPEWIGHCDMVGYPLRSGLMPFDFSTWDVIRSVGIAWNLTPSAKWSMWYLKSSSAWVQMKNLQVLAAEWSEGARCVLNMVVKPLNTSLKSW